MEFRRTSDAIQDTARAAKDVERDGGSEIMRSGEDLTSDRPVSNTGTGNPAAVSHSLRAGDEIRQRRLYVSGGRDGKGDAVQLVPSRDGSLNICKPIDRESHMRAGIPHDPGQMAIRGESGYRLSQLFNMNRIPATAITGSPYGRSLVQDFVPSREMLGFGLHDPAQEEEMAFLDYIMGNTDGNLYNYRMAIDPTDSSTVREEMSRDFTGRGYGSEFGLQQIGNGPFRKGDLFEVDQALILPTEPDPNWGIRSHFATPYVESEIPFSEGLLARADAVSPQDIREVLKDFGAGNPRLDSAAIEGAQDRLAEVQTDRMITGRNWPGQFTV